MSQTSYNQRYKAHDEMTAILSWADGSVRLSILGVIQVNPPVYIHKEAWRNVAMAHKLYDIIGNKLIPYSRANKNANGCIIRLFLRFFSPLFLYSLVTHVWSMC